MALGAWEIEPVREKGFRGPGRLGPGKSNPALGMISYPFPRPLSLRALPAEIRQGDMKMIASKVYFHGESTQIIFMVTYDTGT